jgi:hypothetical protein
VPLVRSPQNRALASKFITFGALDFTQRDA